MPSDLKKRRLRGFTRRNYDPPTKQLIAHGKLFVGQRNFSPLQRRGGGGGESAGPKLGGGKKHEETARGREVRTVEVNHQGHKT